MIGDKRGPIRTKDYKPRCTVHTGESQPLAPCRWSRDLEQRHRNWKNCSEAMLKFLTSTDVGRLVPPLEEGDAGSEVSQWELRERKRSGRRWR